MGETSIQLKKFKNNSDQRAQPESHFTFEFQIENLTKLLYLLGAHIF